MRADKARVTKARKAMLMADAEESVNMSSCPSLMLFVNGIADDADDINRYAIICSKQANQPTIQSLAFLLSWHSYKALLPISLSKASTLQKPSFF